MGRGVEYSGQVHRDESQSGRPNEHKFSSLKPGSWHSGRLPKRSAKEANHEQTRQIGHGAARLGARDGRLAFWKRWSRPWPTAIRGNDPKKPRTSLVIWPKRLTQGRTWRRIEFELPYILAPLAQVKENLLVMRAGPRTRPPHGDGAGDHAGQLASFPHGNRPARPTCDIKVGVSVDQVAARKIGQRTRLLRSSSVAHRGAQPATRPGYSCSYSTNISWRTESTPQAKEIDPKLAFERLFSTGAAGNAKTAARSTTRACWTSCLRTPRLQAKLGVKDQRKLDEYLSSVREWKSGSPGRQRARHTAARLPGPLGHSRGLRHAHPPDVRPAGLAFQGDLTRVATFVVANEGATARIVHRRGRRASRPVAPRRRPEEARKDSRDQTASTSRTWPTSSKSSRAFPRGAVAVGQLDDPLRQRHRRTQRHNHDNLPIVLAGRGGDTIHSGRHLKLNKETPLNNL